MVDSVGAASSAVRQVAASSATMRTSQAQLGSGNRITRPSLDAASLAIGNVLRADVGAASQAQRNVSQGSSLLQVAGGGLDQMGQLLDRIGQLSVQAGNGGLSGTELGFIQEEINGLVKQFGQTAEGTRFNGQSLLGGEAGELNFQASEESDDILSVAIGGLSVSGLKLDSINILAPGGAASALQTISGARDTINTQLSAVGATQSRFESVSANLETINENRLAARATFTDADFADSAITNASAQVQNNVGIALAAQANKLAPALLRLIG